MKKLLALLIILFPLTAHAAISQLPDPLTYQYYGAACDGTTDDGTIIDQVNQLALLSGHCIHLTGNCYRGTQWKLDFNGLADTQRGICIYGDNWDTSRFTIGTSSSPGFLVEHSGNSTIQNVNLKNIGIFTNIAGTGSQLGETSFGDNIADSSFENVYFANSSSSSSCIAVQFNTVLLSKFFGLANCGGHGDDLQIDNADFDTFQVSGGSADNMVHITNGTSYGNVFNAMDMEAVNTNDVLIDSANAHNNTFIGGQWAYQTGGHGINFTAGYSNEVHNPNFWQTPGQVNNTTGLALCGTGPNFPAGYSACNAGGSGSPAGSSGQVQYNNSGAFGGLTNTQLTADINAFTSSLSGAVPSSGGGTSNFLRADGTWAAPSGGGGSGFTNQDNETSSRSLGSVYQNTSGATMFVTVSTNQSTSDDMEAVSDSSSSPSTEVAYGGGRSSISFMVLNNNYYEVEAASGSPHILSWVEWH